MDIEVFASGRAVVGSHEYQCAVGSGGVTESKTEGDKKTPLGIFPLREVLWRKDRVPEIQTQLPAQGIRPCDGWCDDPHSPFYNRSILLPSAEHHEELWRSDSMYDIIVVIGYNDAPPILGRGSAIFIHVAREGYPPTDGCIALKKEDLLEILPLLSSSSHIWIKK